MTKIESAVQDSHTRQVDYHVYVGIGFDIACFNGFDVMLEQNNAVTVVTDGVGVRQLGGDNPGVFLANPGAPQDAGGDHFKLICGKRRHG